MCSAPIAPIMIWDIPAAVGFADQTVAWRGNGTFGASQFVPKVFTLAAGTHTLIIRGREAGTQLGAITISRRGLTPPWQTADLGSANVTGAANISGGNYTLSGAGTLSGSSDNFRFLYQPLTGDGEISAQISSVQ